MSSHHESTVTVNGTPAGPVAPPHHVGDLLIIETECAFHLSEELAGAVHVAQGDLRTFREAVDQVKARPRAYVTRRELIALLERCVVLEWRQVRLQDMVKRVESNQIELLRRLTEQSKA